MSRIDNTSSILVVGELDQSGGYLLRVPIGRDGGRHNCPERVLHNLLTRQETVRVSGSERERGNCS
jgi:hypothetical protein